MERLRREKRFDAAHDIRTTEICDSSADADADKVLFDTINVALEYARIDVVRWESQ